MDVVYDDAEHASNNDKHVHKCCALRLQHAASTLTVPLTAISNDPFTEHEYNAWKNAMNHAHKPITTKTQANVIKQRADNYTNQLLKKLKQ